MANIKLKEGIPGIVALFAFNPATSQALNGIAEALLRADNTIERHDRELIATYVSSLNRCEFCTKSHAAVVRGYYRKMGGKSIIDGEAIIQDALDNRTEESELISSKMKALLNIAAKVQQSGKHVDDESLELAREQGATDKEIHDTVLIAAAFCMFNRYVDGLDAPADISDEAYNAIGDMLVENGYTNSKPVEVL